MRNSILVLALACGAGFSSSAMAQEQVYGGIGLGIASIDIPSDVLDDGSAISGRNINDSDTSLSIFVGYEVSNVISIEGGYIDFGATGATGQSDGTGIDWAAGPVEAKLEGSALFVDVVGKHAIDNQFQLLGKVGIYRADLDASRIDVATSGSWSSSNNGLLLGFGASYSIAPNISVRVDWTRYMDVGDYPITESDIDVLALNIVYNFN